jgi:hypothetical protein
VDLTDLATVKKYLNLTSTTSDAVLASLASSQSQAFYDLIGRVSLESQAFTEVRDGRGASFMQLVNFPLTALDSLQIDSSVVPASTGWNKSGYQFDELGKVSLIGFTFCVGRRNVIAIGKAGYLPIAVTNELQTIPAATPFTLQAAQSNWRSDVSVNFFIGGAALTPVLVAPGPGQYFVVNGNYLFNTADAGKQVLLNYNRAGIPMDVVQAVNEMAALRYRQRDRLDTDSVTIGNTTTTYSKEDYPKDVWQVIKKYKRYFFAPGF